MTSSGDRPPLGTPPVTDEHPGHDPITAAPPDPRDRVVLLWLPLGAGGSCVRISGRLFERLAARRAGRAPVPLFHAALEVTQHGTAHVIEMGPAWGLPGTPDDRGVVQQGPVGLSGLGVSPWFRYEVRRWRDGRIDDREQAAAVQELTDDPERVRAVLTSVPRVPAFTWGRDALGVADMWNSNSLISWLLVQAGLDAGSLHPPQGGRAPGWRSGLALAARETNVVGGVSTGAVRGTMVPARSADPARHRDDVVPTEPMPPDRSGPGRSDPDRGGPSCHRAELRTTNTPSTGRPAQR